MKINVTNIRTGILIYSEHHKDLGYTRQQDGDTGQFFTSYLHPDLEYFWSGRFMPWKECKKFAKSQQFVVLNQAQLAKMWPTQADTFKKGWGCVFQLAKDRIKGSHVDVPAFVKGACPPQLAIDEMQYRTVYFVPQPGSNNLQVVN